MWMHGIFEDCLLFTEIGAYFFLGHRKKKLGLHEVSWVEFLDTCTQSKQTDKKLSNLYSLKTKETSVVPKGYTPYTPYTLRKFQDNLGCRHYALQFPAELLNNSTPS